MKGPEFTIVVWNWRSVIDLYGVGFVAPKRPQVFVLRVFIFVVSRVFLVVEFLNFYPLFSLQNSIFVNKNLLKTQNSCVLLAPAIKESTLEKARERVKHVIRSQKIGGTPKQT